MEPVKKLKSSENTINIRKWHWTIEDSFIWGKTAGFSGSSKVAMFDLDGTIVRPKGKNRHPKGSDDWVFLYPSVPSKIEEAVAGGHSFVIASNQLGIRSGKATAKEITDKIEKISREIDVEFACMFSTNKDCYRKPLLGMWEFFISCLNDGIKPILSDCYYVGDAAGRKSTKDFSASDR